MLGLREVVSKLSVGTRQGYVKCACTNNAKCSTQRCSCKKANIACSSKCHGKSPESNCVNNEAFYNKESDKNEKNGKATKMRERQKWKNENMRKWEIRKW